MKLRRGQTMVELVMVLPVMVFLLLAMAQFGIMINTKIAVTGAAREAARCYAVYKDVSRMRQVAEDYLKGTVTASASEFATSFNKNQDVDYEVDSGYVTVTVRYRQKVFVPGLFSLVGGGSWPGMQDDGRVPLRSAAVFRIEE